MKFKTFMSLFPLSSFSLPPSLHRDNLCHRVYSVEFHVTTQKLLKDSCYRL